MTARSFVKDDRGYAGVPPARVELPLADILPRCRELCSWVMVRQGVARLKYISAMCPSRHDPAAEVSGD